MNEQQNKRRRKKSVNFPAAMFLELLFTGAVLIAAVAGKNRDSTGPNSNIDKSPWNLTRVNTGEQMESSARAS